MLKPKSGFTLVELLIVVAIIGVLSTIGVPTFRKMIAKARQAEAKVTLGAIYKAETAFVAEYNVYGNNLSALGVELELTRYSAGFPMGGCASTGVAMVPTKADPEAKKLNADFPGYFDLGKFRHTFSPPDATASDRCVDGAVGNISSYFVLLWTPCGWLECVSQCFVATATGAITSGVSPTDPLEKQDGWYINHNRQLAHICAN